MNINLTKQEFLQIKKWLNIEVNSAEQYIQKGYNNIEKEIMVKYLKGKLEQLKPIADKINEEYENITIKIK